MQAALAWKDRIHASLDGLLASPRFRRWAAAFPLTRPIARRRARELFDLCAGFVYSQVLLAEGAEAALAQHVLWGFMAAYLAIHGPGRWSLDAWLGKTMSMRHSTPAYA